jgi:hypothetical protein
MLIFILTICILFSGCVEESKVNQSNESVHQGSVNITPKNLSSTTLSSEAENIPEIKVRSFSSIYTHSNLEKVEGYLFSWDNVPGNESQRLINYLKNDLNISWVDNAQIVKTNNNETIRVFTSGNSLELTLDNNQNMILTTIDSVPFYLSKIKKENGKIYVYRLEEYKSVYNITEKYYAVYNLSITNNGSKNIDFKLNELNVRDGNHIFNSTIELESPYFSYNNEILSDLEKETKLEDTTLSPGQTINGSVVFQVNSSYNESFLLMYKETPITSSSFIKSTEALRTAEQYNYSIVFGIPPYSKNFEHDSFEPDLEEYPYIWSNWVNKSVVEYFKKVYSDRKLNYSSNDIPQTEIVYALKVIPERNITSTIERYISYPDSYPENHLMVVDDTGEELINKSVNRALDKIVILKDQTYERHSGEKVDTPPMHFSNVTIVKISYQNYYGKPMANSISQIDQDLILDDEKNIILARYHCGNYMS